MQARQLELSWSIGSQWVSYKPKATIKWPPGMFGKCTELGLVTSGAGMKLAGRLAGMGWVGWPLEVLYS